MITIKKAEAEGTIDTKAAIERLYAQQAARVDKLETAEATYNPEIRKEMKLLAEIWSKVTEFYFAIGVSKKAPRTTTVKNDGTTTVIESPGRTHVLLSIQEKAQLQEARKKLDALLEEEYKAQKLLH